jgi:hypothetical protein
MVVLLALDLSLVVLVTFAIAHLVVAVVRIICPVMIAIAALIVTILVLSSSYRQSPDG